jgi:hypothetical protein
MALVALATVLALVFARHRRGTLNVAAWLVVWGAPIVMTEYPLVAIGFLIPIPSI